MDVGASSFWRLYETLKHGNEEQPDGISGTVQSVDQDGTAWVLVDGADEPVPVSGTSAAVSEGDSVTVQVGDGRATIVGNTSEPAVGMSAVNGAVAPVARKVEGIVGSVAQAAKASEVAQAAAQAAQAVAESVGQHFWTADDGVHVTEVTEEEWNDQTGTSYHSGANVLISSIGQLFRSGLNNLLGFVTSPTTGVAIFDGLGNAAANILASFTSEGTTIGRLGQHVLRMTGANIWMLDPSASPVFHVGSTYYDARTVTDTATVSGLGVGGGPTLYYDLSETPDYDSGMTLTLTATYEGVYDPQGTVTQTTTISYDGNQYWWDFGNDEGVEITESDIRLWFDFTLGEDDTENWNVTLDISATYRSSAGEKPNYLLGVGVGNVGDYAMATGYATEASGEASHAEGSRTVASGLNAHAEGSWSVSSAITSHAEGMGSSATSLSAHAEGYITTASGNAAHSEGQETTAGGSFSHAEGAATTASGSAAHSEGREAKASGNYSHAEGYKSSSSSSYAHAEGYYAYARGSASHAEGYETRANGSASHAQNRGTKAAGDSQTALGKYNVEDANDTYAAIIGNGTSDSARSNALTVDWSGNVDAAGSVSAANFMATYYGDLDDLTAPGVYYVHSTATNRPVGGSFPGVIIVTNNGAGYVGQLFAAFGAKSPGMFARRYSGSWGAWATFADTQSKTLTQSVQIGTFFYCSTGYVVFNIPITNPYDQFTSVTVTPPASISGRDVTSPSTTATMTITGVREATVRNGYVNVRLNCTGGTSTHSYIVTNPFSITLALS